MARTIIVAALLLAACDDERPCVRYEDSVAISIQGTWAKLTPTRTCTKRGDANG